MKRINLFFLIGLLSILMLAGSGKTARADTLSSQGQGLYEYTDVEIGGRQYSYILYYEDSEKKVSLVALRSRDEKLYIPAQIGDMTVVNIGITTPVDSNGERIAWENLKGEGNKSDLPWNDSFTPWQENTDSELDEVIIQEGIEHIFGGALRGSRINTLEVASTVRDIGVEPTINNFGESKGRVIKHLVLKGKSTAIGNSAFENYGIESIKWPDDFCGTIGESAFARNINLKKVSWPAYKGKNTKKCVGIDAFHGCEGLKEVTFPKNMEHIYIPENCFFYCKKLKKLTFPASTKKVTYSTHTYADNHKVGVRTLQFNGKKTKLKGGEYYVDYFTLTNKKFLTVTRVIAPKNSYAIKYAKKAEKLKRTERWFGRKGYWYGNITTYYRKNDDSHTLSKVTCSYLKK